MSLAYLKEVYNHHCSLESVFNFAWILLSHRLPHAHFGNITRVWGENETVRGTLYEKSLGIS